MPLTLDALYRHIGDTTVDVLTHELTRVNSPMLPDAAAIHAAASPHSALFLAMSWLGDVFPRFTEKSVANCRNGDPVTFSEISSTHRRGKVSNLSDRLGIEFCPAASLHVDDVRDKFHVGRIHAPSIPTEMVNFHVCGDRAVHARVHVSMCRNIPSLRRVRSIPVALHGSLPDPTFGFRVNDIELCRQSAVMIRQKPSVVTLISFALCICGEYYRRGFSAPALTQPRRVGVGEGTAKNGRAMSVKTRTTPLCAAGNAYTAVNTTILGMLSVHRGVTPYQSFRGAVPRAVLAAPGHSRASIIPENRAVMGFLGGAA